MKKYQIVIENSPGKLSAIITAMLADRWELWGNPFTWNGSVCQAVVRYEFKETESTAVHTNVAGYVVGTPG